MDRSRSYSIALAVREFVETEYSSLAAIREGERELAAGKEIPQENVSGGLTTCLRGKVAQSGFVDAVGWSPRAVRALFDAYE